MVDNQLHRAKNHEDIRDNFIQYGLPYRTNINDSNFDYYRSSCSSSSSGSGKVLVHRSYVSPYHTASKFNPIFQEEPTPPRDTSLTPQTGEDVGKFCIGGYLRPPPTSPELTASCLYAPEPANPGLLAVPQLPEIEATSSKLSRNYLCDPRDANASKMSAIPESFWKIPRANLWCSHKDCLSEGSKCSVCELKDETTSNCSSENPPPTFTALDNIHPIRRRKRWCKCAITCLTTSTFCFLILSIIGGFILYVEVVLKKNQYVPEPM